MLTSVGKADTGDSGGIRGNRDTRAGTIGLTVEEHHIAAALAGDCVVAMGANMDLLVVAAGYQCAASVSGIRCESPAPPA